MSSGTKRRHAEALADADALRELVGPEYWVKWEVAGSVRRNRPEVGDVEHVVIGRPGILDRIDELTEGVVMFGGDKPFRKAVYQNGTNRWGDKYRGIEFRGFKHELFFATTDNWGAILTIRTGPAEFSQRMVTMLKSGGVYRQQDGHVIYQSSGEVIPCRDEQTFFEMCGMRYLQPHERI